MESIFIIVAIVLAVIGGILLVPVLLFRPLVLAISNRIAGKQGDNEEMKKLKGRVALLEQQLNEIHGRMGAIEDSSHFAHKVLEDVVKKTTVQDAEKAASNESGAEVR